MESIKRGYRARENCIRKARQKNLQKDFQNAEESKGELLGEDM